MTITALIIGIDGWDRYTKPLIDSIRRYEPDAVTITIDNASLTPYPAQPMIFRTPRLSYAAAINWAHGIDGDTGTDWYIVLSNDVLCTGPFAHILERYGDGDLVGPCLKHVDIEQVGRVPYLEGWTVAVPGRIWDTIGGWDEGMQISSYEDVEYSHRARVNGFGLIEDPALPFVHLDQKQRFYLVPNYWDSEYHNRARFIEKYGQRVTT